ncbi:type IV secretory system conjugative DNA transfer family protein [Haloglomus litoreum]|uniref:type IV secretory system conjugative DNA transfer family protein n=1 Tax=Haloglomus litoreum TaxID=3034026 RepID=UPI0023E8A78B|nr:TraM recognition domain-containing protein [Haloglomus sp. DT116]
MAAADDSPSTLPATPYITIKPADSPLDPATVETHLRRLHGLTGSAKGRFLTSASPPTVEWLLTSSGDERGLTYAVGVDDEAAHASLEHAIRGLFPDSYAIAETDRETLLEPFTPAEDTDTVALTFDGNPTHRKDWQTCLTPFAEFHESERDRTHVRAPLAAVAETLADSPVPVCYQVLVRPKADWSVEADERRLNLEQGSDTFGGKLMNALVGPPPEDELVMLGADEERVVHLGERDTHRSFEVNVRAIAGHDSDPVDAERILRDLALAFEPVSGPFYRIEGTVATGTEAQQLVEELHGRTLHPPAYGRSLTSPGRTSPGLVVDARELGSFCALPGDALTSAGVRGVGVTPSERTGLSLPPADQLAPYSGAGMTLGLPLTDDDQATDEPLVLPPSLQPLHIGWFGRTGAGKSTALVNAMLANHRATDGASILVDPKGDGMGEAYLRAHFAEYGSLEDVLYFDCAAVLPAISFFDIRGELEAGIPRETAVEDAVDHYIEILRAIMGRDRFDQAVRSPDIIRYLVKALFDPVHGSDHFSHRRLHEAARRMHERQSAPAVSDDDLERMLGGVVANRARTFDEIMQGVANRIEKVPVDRRLARLFNHVNDTEDDGPHFDLVDFLDENVVIVFDTGGLRTEAQRVLALLILSELWTALKRRRKRAVVEDLPLVNLYIEEAASIAVSDLLQELLAQSRSFDCSVTLAMQFPAQLRGYDQDVYDEILNNVSTVLTGNVPSDARFAQRLATDDMDPQQVGNRLRALRRGQWLVSLPAAFGRPEPRPFLVHSAPLPPGHPDGERGLSFDEQSALATARIEMQARTRVEYGLGLSSPSVVREGPPSEDDVPAESEATDGAPPAVRVDSALPHTKRLPPTVEYDGSIHALRCTRCDTRYDPSIDGMKRAIECCSSIDAVDSDDIPICELNLKLTEAERFDSEWSDAQLMFLQAVYNAQQLRFDPLEYDLLWDSMLRLQEYVGIESDAVQNLIDADLLRHDTDRPHRLYTVSPEGRTIIGESYRQGVDYGHGQGDLEESSEHVLGVEIGRRYLEGTYRDDPESDVVEVVPYYDLGENQRLDIAGIDDEGDVVVAIEVERVNHDIKRAVPEDFDKMAACNPEEAIWIVMSHTEGHEVLAALNDPLDGAVRVEKTYAKTSPVSSFMITEPGLTAMYTLEQVRGALGGKGPAA